MRYRGIFILDENIIHESVAKEIWFPILERKCKGKPEGILLLQILKIEVCLYLEDAQETSKTTKLTASIFIVYFLFNY